MRHFRFSLPLLPSFCVLVIAMAAAPPKPGAAFVAIGRGIWLVVLLSVFIVEGWRWARSKD